MKDRVRFKGKIIGNVMAVNIVHLYSKSANSIFFTLTVNIIINIIVIESGVIAHHPEELFWIIFFLMFFKRYKNKRNNNIFYFMFFPEELSLEIWEFTSFHQVFWTFFWIWGIIKMYMGWFLKLDASLVGPPLPSSRT